MCFFLYFSSIIHLNGKLFISCMLYLLYPSVIEFIFFIVNKQTTSIPRTFEKLATPLVPAIPLAQSTFSGGFYPVSPRQLLRSDTGVPHFALDPLTHRCLLSLSPAADFAEPRPPRHTRHPSFFTVYGSN